MDIFARYIHSVDKLVPRPEIALTALKMALDPRCSIPLLASYIERDPSLTANMLRIANSAFFGHMRTINSVKDYNLGCLYGTGNCSERGQNGGVEGGIDLFRLKFRKSLDYFGINSSKELEKFSW